MVDNIRNEIEEASEAVGSAWPLHSFVTANPLSGFEDEGFDEAVREGNRLFGGDGYPSPETLRAAWEDGRIDDGILVEELREAGYDLSPEEALESMGEGNVSTASLSDNRVDRVLAKWLSAFCDQGRAEAPMPHREKGFYEACRRLVKYDGDIPNGESLADLPEDPAEAVDSLISDVPEGDRAELFEHHLSALPGWTAFVKQRAEDGSEWQDEYHIDLVEYLAVRLAVADALGAELLPDGARDEDKDDTSLRAAWLSAWERTYRDGLISRVKEANDEGTVADGGRPDAQMVFCIDTRSEVIRRAVEETGDYDTHGYAGFFGVPIRYDAYDDDVTVDACPPIVDPAHKVPDTPVDGDEDGADKRGAWKALKGAYVNLITKLETNVATAYSYVEMSGVGYGARMAARTLFPSLVHDSIESDVPSRNEVCEPELDPEGSDDHELPVGMTKEEMAEYADTAFSLMGWEEFARLAVFVGHASETQNNPFDSALDCGACAGNPGGPNARILAAICNDQEVREILAERGHEIPDDTVFLAGEHNTTTDEVEIFADDVPESHEEDLESLREDLEEARRKAAADRAETMSPDPDDPARDVQRRAADWAETRPEWGLAGNAAFVIGPRELTEDINLHGRSFLHSYDWRTDEDGEALEAIMQGPMVVTQWINNQYYFATVDNAVYGSGSKVTQNPVGNVGVYQGNGGDIMTGLPLQSLYLTDDDLFHQPLRLTTVIHAPVDTVESVLEASPSVANLLDNGWLSLTVVDPETDEVFEYDGNLSWTSETQMKEQAPKTTADD